MDLAWLSDLLGDGGAGAVGGLALGMVFGVFAQRSSFCLRAAVVEVARGALGPKLAIWLLAFASAVLFTQALVEAGAFDVSEARQLATTGSLSGALIGGLLFGVGMVLARGCSSRLLVLSATGNLRALLSGLIFAVVAQASLRGHLAPLRDALAGLWTVSARDTLDALALLGLGHRSGVFLGALFLAGAASVAVRNRLAVRAWVGELGVGATVAAGWGFTHALAAQSFAVTRVESITFTGPSANTLMLVLSPPGTALDFAIGLVPGVFAGSFLAAAASGEVKLQGFEGGHSMRRYILGAVLMGFGGMLAGGCAVGAGLSGGSVFALTAWTTLPAMWAGAALTDAVVDRGWRPSTAARIATAP